jgi:selenocysteine lyase/cysteine desulfurase
MFKKYYSEFLSGHSGKIHMAGHSHHFWPDISKEAHMLAWEKSRELSDNKWNYLLGEVLPDVQKIISSHINFPRPKDIAFASNTHELIVKLISCFFEQDKIRILTSKSEFHSLSRQLKRFEESDKFVITYLEPESENFESAIQTQLKNNNFDLVIFSHVFFNSGKVLKQDIIKTIISLKGDALFALDAYHGYCAIPTDISQFSDDIFYIAGGYKYAQAGEGMCFMTLPENCKLRPSITGWFASFETLEDSSTDTTQYSEDGMRFWGSTLDMTSFLRFRAIWDHFHVNGIDIERFDQYIKSLQKQFLNNNKLNSKFKYDDLALIGHFITFEFESNSEASETHNLLKAQGILTDFRGSHLRFGFTPYLNQDDIEHVKMAINSLELFDTK